MNKKYILGLVLVLVISFSVYKYSNSEDNTEYITVELGNNITWDMGKNTTADIDLGFKIKSVKIVNQPYNYYDFNIKVDGTSLKLNYSSNSLEKTIPREVFNYGTMPLTLYGGETIELGVNEGDVAKLRKLAEKQQWSFEGDTVKLNKLRLSLIDFWTGKLLEIEYPVAPNDIKDFLVDVLQPEFEKGYKDNKDAYLQYYSNVIEDTENLLGEGSDAEKIQNLLNFMQNIKPIPENITKKGQFQDPDYVYRLSIDNLLRNNEGICQNIAYYTKFVLDSIGFENELVIGYMHSKDSTEKVGHVINAVKLNKSWKYTEAYATEFMKLNNEIPEEVMREAISSNSKYLSNDWIFIDAGYNAIDNPGIYFTFISTQEMDM